MFATFILDTSVFLISSWDICDGHYVHIVIIKAKCEFSSFTLNQQLLFFVE